MTNKTSVATFLRNYGGVLALVVATTATIGSLYYSEIAGFVPCTLCWYQRILMYPLVLITLVGIIEQDEYLSHYVLPLAVIGIGVSGYHVLIQNGIFSHPATCTVGVPCSLRYVNHMGFITIPLMALTAFVLIVVVMTATRWASSQYLLEDMDTIEVNRSEEDDLEKNISRSKRWIPISGVLLLIMFLALAGFRDGISPENTQSMVKTSVLDESLFEQPTLGDAPGCIACHSLEPNVVIVGPSVASIAKEAGDRVPGQSAAEYLREAIVNPNSFIVAGFPEGVMYQKYGEKLTEDQIDDLVSFLLALKE